MRGIVRTLLISLAALGVAAPAAAGTREIVRLEANGVVDPFLANYIVEGIEEANDNGAAGILIRVDTPGGLDSSMREIIRAILDSQVPVFCHVAPNGARAASAGAFILMACPVAAMAPATNVGAAAPVGISGAILREKVVNDAAAYIRSLAQQRDRNADWAERAVRDAVSASAEEALELDVIDLIADDTEELLRAVDGMAVETGAGSVTIDVTRARVVDRSMGIGGGLLHALFTPDLAFIFFYLGIGLLIVEILHPGLSVPGVLGVLFLAASFASFGMLPVDLVGVILLIVSMAFFVIEVKAPGLSGSGVMGLVTLVVGGLLLFDRAVPGGGVSIATIAPVGIAMLLFFAFVIPRALGARRLPKRDAASRIVGMEGVAITPLNPTGVVHVGAEEWSAEALDGTIDEGGRIKVAGTEGLRLMVRRAEDASPEAVPVPAEKEA